MWPSCLNNFLTKPEQKGQSGDCTLSYSDEIQPFENVRESCCMCINKYFQSDYTDNVILIAALLWNYVEVPPNANLLGQ